MTQDPAPRFGGRRQMEIYLAGSPPAIPVNPRRLEREARRRLPREVYDFVAGGAGAESTLRANRAAFAAWRIVPRMLRDVSHRELATTLLGHTLPAPLLLAPVGAQSILHPEAELAPARAAAALGLPLVVSTVSSLPLETIAQAGGPRWFQLYWGSDRELVASMLHRAEAAGYSALVLTLDSPMLGWRMRDLERAYMPFLHGEGIGNFTSDPVFCRRLGCAPADNLPAAVQLWGRLFSNPALTWNDLEWLRAQTRLPLALKGILRADDAARALEAGADALIVSNHGGRQVDGSIAALDALPGVVNAAGGRVPVLFDSGIRHGADAVKALALGARAVLLGRLYLWGLALAGEAGVAAVLANFLGDLDLTLALGGCRTPAEADAGLLRPAAAGG